MTQENKHQADHNSLAELREQILEFREGYQRAGNCAVGFTGDSVGVPISHWLRVGLYRCRAEPSKT